MYILKLELMRTKEVQLNTEFVVICDKVCSSLNMLFPCLRLFDHISGYLSIMYRSTMLKLHSVNFYVHMCMLCALYVCVNYFICAFYSFNKNFTRGISTNWLGFYYYFVGENKFLFNFKLLNGISLLEVSRMLINILYCTKILKLGGTVDFIFCLWIPLV